MSNEFNSYIPEPDEMHWLVAEGGRSSQGLNEILAELPVEGNQAQFGLQGNFLHLDNLLEPENFPNITTRAAQQALEECPAAQGQEGEYGPRTQFDILQTIDGVVPAAPAEISEPATEWQAPGVPENSPTVVQVKGKGKKRPLEQERESTAEPTPSSHTQPQPRENRPLKRSRTSKDAGPVAEEVHIASACAGSSSRSNKDVAQGEKSLTKTTSRKCAQGENAKPPTRGKANSHLTPEEKRKIRAEKNRESAERSRMKQKKKAEELENSVHELRKVNRGLAEISQEISAELEGSLREIRDSINGGDVVEDKVSEKVQSLREALAMIKKAEEDCPWTFQDRFLEQEIPLNLKPSAQQPGTPQ